MSDQPLRQRRYGRLLAFGSLTSVIAMMAMVGFMLIDGYRPVVITTGSMGDTAPPSSIIVAAPRPAENVQLGDILVMQRDGRATVTHRVVAIEPGANDQRLAITKGDANPVVDAEPYRLVGDPLVGRWIMPTGGGLLLRLGDPFTALAVVLGAVSLVTFVALRWIWWAPPPQAGASEESDDAGAATATGRRPARVAVSLATFLGVFFGGVAWSLFDANDGVANNQFGTAACFDATVAGIQSGVATNAAEGVQQITVGAVDPTRSILLTSARGAAAEPADAMVVATLADATTIELTRRTDAVAPPALDVAWTLVEFQCGVTVQRGTTLGNDAAFLDIAVSPVDTDDSFVLTTSSTDRADSAHDGDDDHLAVLAGASTLRLRAASGGTLPSDHLYGWQLLSYSDGGDVSVQTDMATLSASDNLTVNLATPVDPATTLIIAHAASAGTGAPIGDRQVRAHLSSPSTVQLTRLASGGPLEVTLQIVTFTDGTLVQHGIVNLANGQPSADVALNPVDPSRATAMSTVDAPGSLSGGATDSGDPTALGSSSATFALSDPATLRVERTDAGANASFGWQVIEWGGPSWWDTDYPFRQRIDVTTTSSASPDGYSVPVTIDHANMVTSGLSLASGDDLRLLRWDGASWVELDRVLDDASGWDNAATTMWFRTTASIDVLSSDSYWLYYGNPAPPAPMADPDLVWLLDEDFESGTLGAFEDRTGGTGWYTADAWTERIPLTVSSAEVDQDLFDFPVLVRLVDAALGAGAQADGDDIRFALGDGTPLDHEIEDWDSASGSLIAWVRLPTVSSTTDTSFHLYYGAANAADQQRPTAVWGDAEAVWHLDRDPAGSAPQLDDLSAHRRDGLSSGSMTSTDLVSGVAGKAIDFDGIDDVLQAQPFAVASDVLTLSAWVDFDSNAADSVIVAQAGSSASRRYELGTAAGGALRFRLDLDGATTELVGGSVPVGGWHHVAATWNGATMSVLIDGSVVASGPATGALGNSATMPVTVGNVPGNDRGVDGRIDEVRVESDFRPLPWLLAAYRNQRPGSTFVSVGAHETGTWFAQGTWAYRSPIGVEIDPGASALTDFPLLVEFTSPDLVGATQLDGDDVVFTDRDGITRLDHQLESFDSGAGSVTAWVRVPSLDLDSQLFVYYGNPSAADQSDAENVFGDGADLVLHD